MASVLVIGTMDTKGPESHYLAERINDLGCDTLVLDSGILGDAVGITPDFNRDQVAAAGGTTIDALRNAGSRGKAIEGMLVGVRTLTCRLEEEGRIQGVVALGGAEGAVLASAAMKALPLGLPKLIVSPIASGHRTFAPFMGTKDVLVMHSVIDILGLNTVSRNVFDGAAAAIAGMARAYESGSRDRPDSRCKQIACTMLGNTTKPLMWLKDRLEPDGYDLVIFHANGVGGPAMEELCEQGMFQGVIDFTLSELAGEAAGGFHVGGPHRMELAGRLGLPQVVAPGCVDFAVFGARSQVPEALRDRPSYYHNPEFTLVRLSRDEQLAVARMMARKLNAANGPVSVLVPTRGFSVPNHEHGGEFWDPETDDAFRAELESELSSSIDLVKIDAHINDEAFVQEVLKSARALFGKERAG